MTTAQAIIDNYSRFIFSWIISLKADGINTAMNLQMAKENALKLGLNTESLVVMDGGKENNNHIVDQIIYERNLKRAIAKVDIIHSNSMVEALFRALKNNYLYHHPPKTLASLTKRVSYYFHQW